MYKIDAQWIEQKLFDLAQIGKHENGITRLCYTDEAFLAEQYVISVMEEIGLTVRRDAVGNIFARLHGKDDSLPAVATGSHLDTAKDGGAYDGTVGVVSALSALNVLRDKELNRSIEIIVFMAEESSRFGLANIGARFMTDKKTFEKLKIAERNGFVSFTETMSKIGYDANKLNDAYIADNQYAAFLEVHIEQDRVLYDSGDKIGIVKTIAAPVRYKVKVKGEAGHSGSVHMESRKDALVSASKLVLVLNKIAKSYMNKNIVATVGALEVHPNVINTIPGKVILQVDIRGTDKDVIHYVKRALLDGVRDVAKTDKIVIEIDVISNDYPVDLDKNIAQVLETVIKNNNLKYRVMDSRATHDSALLARKVPTGMIFIPCVEGISHNKNEKAEIADIELGAKVLAEALYSLAK